MAIPCTLGTATNFAILGASTVTNTGATIITGDLGLFPGTSVTGFPPGIVTGGTQYITDTTAQSAQTDANTAYVCLQGISGGTDLGLVADIGGQTLSAGTYNAPSSLAITETLVLDAGGDPDATFVFQVGSTFIPSNGAIITLINGAQGCNVYWAVGSSATLSTSSTTFGTIIASESITFNTNASLEGRAIALNGAVTLDTNDVNNTCVIEPTPTPTPTNTSTPTNTPTNTLTQSSTPTNTPTQTGTPNPTPTNTPTQSLTPTNTPTQSLTPTNTPTPTQTGTPNPTNTPTQSSTPTNTPTQSSTPTNTPTPTQTGTQTPTPTQTGTPTPTPSNTPGYTGITVDNQYATLFIDCCDDISGTTVPSTVNVPHPIFTSNDGTLAITQLNGVALGGFNGLNN